MGARRQTPDESGAVVATADIDEWLYRCEGFTVESPEGRIGTVKEIRYGPSRRWDRPSALAIHAGRASRRSLIVPVENITAIYGEDRRIVLRSSPHVIATEQHDYDIVENANGSTGNGRGER